jgi:hypothetical protein
MLCDMEGRHSMDTVPHRLRGKVDLDNFEKAGGTVAAHGAPPDRDDDDDLARQIAPDARTRGGAGRARAVLPARAGPQQRHASAVLAHGHGACAMKWAALIALSAAAASFEGRVMGAAAASSPVLWPANVRHRSRLQYHRTQLCHCRAWPSALARVR